MPDPAGRAENAAVSRLEYSSPQAGSIGRGYGYWLLFVLNCITLVIGAIAAGLLYRDDNLKFGRVNAFYVAGPSSLIAMPITVLSCRLSRTWYNPLSILSVASALLNSCTILAIALS